ncbi:MAG: hypothetical protein JWQ14_2353, partial [Adhaeribacter sp.]|nr:hypothetical protein [Adhaeribacter sp.]
PQKFPGLSRIHLLGFGLEKEELAQLDSVQIIPHLSPMPEGIIATNWKNKIRVGESLIISGQFYQEKKKKITLVLQSGTTILDSFVVSTAGVNRFTLRYQPKQAGRFVFSLVRHNSSGPQLAGLIPVQVEPRKLHQVLLLPASPNFEFKFLKNFLAGQQHGVAWRIPISKNIYQTEYLNISKKPLNQLTPALLRNFDLIITQPNVLQNLKAAERIALSQAVERDGLGLLLIPENLPLKATSSLSLFQSFKFLNRPNPSENLTRIIWQNQVKASSASTLPFAIVPQTSQKKLVWAGENILAASQKKDWGTVGVTLVSQTCSWQLAGNKTVYAEYWSILLGQLVKPEIQDYNWHLPQPLSAVVHRPVSLQLSDYTFTASAALPQVSVNNTTATTMAMPLQQDPVLPHRFTGMFWPREVGWYQVKKTNDSPTYFFVYPDSIWQAARQNQLVQQNQDYVQKQLADLAVGKIKWQEEPVSPVWFFGLFLLAAGSLWV